jgi:Tfp pilus assembly protein PilN
VILLGAALLCLALSVATTWRAKADLAQAELSAERLREQTEADVARARTLRSSRDGATERLVFPRLLTVDSPPPTVLAELTRLLPGGVRLRRMSLLYGGRLTLELAVAARNAAAYDDFLDRLEASGRFVDVVPGAESRDGEVRSSLRMAYAGEASQ